MIFKFILLHPNRVCQWWHAALSNCCLCPVACRNSGTAHSVCKLMVWFSTASLLCAVDKIRDNSLFKLCHQSCLYTDQICSWLSFHFGLTWIFKCNLVLCLPTSGAACAGCLLSLQRWSYMSACELVVLTMINEPGWPDFSAGLCCHPQIAFDLVVIWQVVSTALVQSLVVSGFLPHKENVDYILNPFCANGNDQVLPLDPFGTKNMFNVWKVVYTWKHNCMFYFPVCTWWMHATCFSVCEQWRSPGMIEMFELSFLSAWVITLPLLAVIYLNIYSMTF